jgi:pilus assembly protein Flp/PilA
MARRLLLLLMAGSATDRGATAVEYSLLVALVAAVIVAVVATLGQQVLQLFAATPGF